MFHFLFHYPYKAPNIICSMFHFLFHYPYITLNIICSMFHFLFHYAYITPNILCSKFHFLFHYPYITLSILRSKSAQFARRGSVSARPGPRSFAIRSSLPSWSHGRQVKKATRSLLLYRDNGKENGNYRDYRDHIGFI